MMESDEAMTEDLVAYNIIPLDAPTITNAIVSFAEVTSFISSCIRLLHFSYLQSFLIC